MSNPKITTHPRNAMELAFLKAVQKRATEKPKKPPPAKPAPPKSERVDWARGLTADGKIPYLK